MKSISSTRSQFRYNKKQVLFLTGMTEEQYNNFQIDTAKEWVEQYWKTIMNTDALLTTTAFWHWWMYEWNQTDERAIISTLYRCHKLQRLSKYRELHQYCFNADDLQQQRMMNDFRHMRKQFDQAIKTPTLL